MRNHARPVIAVLLAASLLVAACGDGGGRAAEAGLIVCSPLDESGEPTPGGLFVVDPSGGEPIAFGEGPLLRQWAQPQGRKLLYMARDTQSWYLVDAAETTVTPLAIASGFWEIVHPAPSSAPPSRFAVLTERGSGEPGLLLDLVTGAAIDLGTILPQAVDFEMVDFDSEGDHALLLDRDWNWWLVPTADPDRAGPVGTRPAQADLADDGTRIAYVEEGSLFLGDLDGPQPQPEAGEVRTAYFVEDGLLILTGDSVLYYDEDDRRSTVLWEGETPMAAGLDLDGRGALVMLLDQSYERTRYLQIDIAGAQATEIGLKEMQPAALASSPHMLLWRLETGAGSVLPRAVEAAAVNLLTGAVGQLDLPDTGLRPDSLQIASTGRYLTAVGGEGDTLWLIDLESADVARVGSRPSTQEAFSPDGTQLVAAIWDGSDRSTTDLVIFDAAAPTEGTSLGVACLSPVWVAGG